MGLLIPLLAVVLCLALCYIFGATAYVIVKDFIL